MGAPVNKSRELHLSNEKIEFPSIYERLTQFEGFVQAAERSKNQSLKDLGSREVKPALRPNVPVKTNRRAESDARDVSAVALTIESGLGQIVSKRTSTRLNFPDALPSRETCKDEKHSAANEALENEKRSFDTESSLNSVIQKFQPSNLQPGISDDVSDAPDCVTEKDREVVFDPETIVADQQAAPNATSAEDKTNYDESRKVATQIAKGNVSSWSGSFVSLDVLKVIYEFLDNNERMNLSISCKFLLDEFSSDREKILAANNFGKTTKKYTGSQISYVKKLLKYNVRMCDAPYVNPREMDEFHTVATDAQRIERRKIVGNIVLANNWPPLDHVLDRKGNLTSKGKKLQRSDSLAKSAATATKVGAALTLNLPVILAIQNLYFDKRHRTQRLPYTHTPELLGKAAKRIAAGEPLCQVAGEFDLYHERLIGVVIETISGGEPLTRLDLSQIPPGKLSRHLDKLAGALALHPELHELDIGANDLDSGDMIHIQGVLDKASGLHKLGLANNELGNAGAGTVAGAVKQHPALMELDMASNNIGAESVNSLCDMLRANKVLRTLNLADNPLDDNAALALARAAIDHPTLVKLVLTGSGLTEDAKKEIREQASKSGKVIEV